MNTIKSFFHAIMSIIGLAIISNPCAALSQTSMTAGMVLTSAVSILVGSAATHKYLNYSILVADELLLKTMQEINTQMHQTYREEIAWASNESASHDILTLAAIVHKNAPLEAYYEQLVFSLTEIKNTYHHIEIRLPAWKSPKHSSLHYLAEQGARIIDEASQILNNLNKLYETITLYYPVIYVHEVLSNSYDTKYYQEAQLYKNYAQQTITSQEYINKLHSFILTKMSDARTPYPYLSYLELMKNDLALIQGSLRACSRIETSLPAYQSLYFQAQEIMKTLQAVHEYIATSAAYQEERIKHEHAEQLHKIAEAEQQKAHAEARIAKAREDEAYELKQQTLLKEQEIEALRQQARLDAEKLEYEMRFQPTRIRLEQEIAQLTKNHKQSLRDKQELEHIITGLRSDLNDYKNTIQRLQLQNKGLEEQRKQLLLDKEKLLDTIHRHLDQIEGLLLTPPYNPASLPDEWPDYFKSIKHIIQYLKQELAHADKYQASTNASFLRR